MKIWQPKKKWNGKQIKSNNGYVIDISNWPGAFSSQSKELYANCNPSREEEEKQCNNRAEEINEIYEKHMWRQIIANLHTTLTHNTIISALINMAKKYFLNNL